MPIGVNLTSNPVTDGCLTIKARSPLAPLKKGGTRVFKVLLQNAGIIGFKVPLLKGDLGGSRLGLNRQTEPAFCSPGIDRLLLV